MEDSSHALPREPMAWGPQDVRIRPQTRRPIQRHPPSFQDHKRRALGIKLRWPGRSPHDAYAYHRHAAPTARGPKERIRIRGPMAGDNCIWQGSETRSGSETCLCATAMTSSIHIGNPTGPPRAYSRSPGVLWHAKNDGRGAGGLGQCEVMKYIMQEGYAQVLRWPLYARSYGRRNL